MRLSSKPIIDSNQNQPMLIHCLTIANERQSMMKILWCFGLLSSLKSSLQLGHQMHITMVFFGGGFLWFSY